MQKEKVMENNKIINVAEAKQLDIVQFLASLGHRPKNVRGTDHWYLSPLHEEKTPSFKVNSALNRWFDFALGQGGNLVDLGI
ncbi:CHC2 zinc finger domain-containing protein [Pedobacter duraquae]|uniref:CHC2 zinc finger domain-containing protein n=1 Tax=Pedobacter duraquae TaxID=425511 RepID=UPI0014152B7F|nr:CHC2 zinc finger domain-containing protein [Pedobacter duraquae]